MCCNICTKYKWWPRKCLVLDVAKLFLFIFEKLQKKSVKFKNVRYYFLLSGILFLWTWEISPHKKPPYSKALGAEFSTCPKKITWLGFKCKLGLISIQKSWRVVGGLVHISPNMSDKVTKKKEFSTPQSVLIYWRNLKIWCFQSWFPT